jgi:hypothetical protein
MSLLSTDITKVKRLSLQEVKLPAPTVEPTPIQAERPLTTEERVYKKFIRVNPLIEKLITSLDLVSARTKEKLQ